VKATSRQLGGRFVVSAAALALLLAPALAPAQKVKDTDAEKKLKNRTLYWTPPLIDSPLPSRISSPCAVSTVLEQAGGRANELVNNLQNFTAQEYIEYQILDSLRIVRESSFGTFDYVVALQDAPGGLLLQENRNPKHGSRLSGVMTQDAGLPEIALMFLPDIQGDYEMDCEGTTTWNRESASVIRFHQRPDKRSRTLSFRGPNTIYPAKLQGRAWIATDSGEVLHMETGLMDEIPAANVRAWFLSINYAPVQFRTRPVKIWLPQIVDAYYEFDDHRTIVYHTFTNFLLFSVDTNQKIEKPQVP
jgi:hypothetical protein